MSPPTCICLLRDRQNGTDPYENAFRAAGYEVCFLPVLTFTHCNLDDLGRRLRDEVYAGIVVTSPRAVEALRKLDPAPDLAGLAIYAVGPRTGDEVRAMGYVPRGERSGKGEELAREIARENPGGKLLFLAGDRRMDATADGLAASGIDFDELTVYETSLIGNLRMDGDPAWFAFFSPSGVEAAERSRLLDAERRLAAIGETTAEALSGSGRVVEAVASQPTPEALVAAVVAADSSR
jgi:uroporphyrinogen-III synthase